MILEEGSVLLDREGSEELMDFVRKVLQIEILAVIWTSFSFPLSKLILSQIIYVESRNMKIDYKYGLVVTSVSFVLISNLSKSTILRPGQ